MKNVNFNKKHVSILFYSCLFLIISLYTIYLIFTKVSIFELNSDTVNEIVYRYTCWKEKTLFPTNFICSNESFTSRPVILYGLIYTLTHNFMGAFLIENCITFVILCAVVYYILHLFISDTKLCVLGVCYFILILPIGAKEVTFYPMNAYVLLAIVVLLTISLRIRILQCIILAKNLTDIIQIRWKIFFLICLAAMSGFVTIKLLMVLYAPFLIYDAVNLVLNFVYRKEIPLFRSFLFILSVLLCVVNIICQLVFTHFYGDTIVPVALTTQTIDRWLDWEVISAQLHVLIQNFGIDFSAQINSAEGLRMLIGMGIFLVNMIILGWYCRESKGKPDSFHVDLFGYWLSATIVMLVFEIITATTVPTNRYFFASAVIWPILAVIAFKQWIDKHSASIQKIANGLVITLLISVFTVNFFCDSNSYRDANVPIIKDVAEYIEESGYRYVTGTYWNSGVITGYTNGAVQSQHSMDLKDFAPFYWLTETTKLKDPRSGEANVIILTDEEETTAIAQNGVLAQILQQYASKVKEIDVYNLYEVQENPFTLAEKIKSQNSLPIEIGEVKVIKPTDPKMLTEVGNLLDSGDIVSNGKEGFLLYGPYINTKAGVYDVYLNYTLETVSDQTQTGVFDVMLDGTTIYDSSHITSDTNSVVLTDLVLEEGHIFESRVWVPEGIILTVHSIEYTRVQ